MDYMDKKKDELDKTIIEMLSTLPYDDVARIYAYIKGLYFS